MKFLTPLACLALAAAGLAHAAPVNLVSNGSFESGPGGIGSFTGWQTALGDAATYVDSSGQTGPHPGQASDGLWSAFFGSTAADGGATISQSLATTTGQSYLLTFDLANDNGGGAAVNDFIAEVNGTPLLAFADLGVQDYAHEQVKFTATGASTLLAFYASNDNGYDQLDKVSVIAVSEPASSDLALAALLAMVIARLRARRQQRDTRRVSAPSN